MDFYPKPTRVHPYISIKPQPLHPLTPPSLAQSFDKPNLPYEAQERIKGDSSNNVLPGYILTTHIIRAASPRTKCEIGPTPHFPMSLPNRKQVISEVADKLNAIRRVNAPIVYDEQEDASNTLWIVVNRFMKKSVYDSSTKARGLTLTVMHANGLHKETWEPTLKAAMTRYPDLHEAIDEIWLPESINHGDSAILNEGRLGNIFNWQDNARDLLQLLLYYMPDTAGEHLNLHLDPLPPHVASDRKINGFSQRKVIGVGHSLGGTSTALVALDSPKLFSDLILVDPVVLPAFLLGSVSTNPVPIPSTISRRHGWPSRESAHDLFLKSPFFQAWDPPVLESYVKYGLTKEPTGEGVRLKMSGFQESVVFAEVRAPVEAWELMSQLDERIELFWILAGEASNVTGGEIGTPETVWRREKNSSNVKVANAGHLIVQIKPSELGQEIGTYLLRKYHTSTTNEKLSKL